MRNHARSLVIVTSAVALISLGACSSMPGYSSSVPPVQGSAQAVEFGRVNSIESARTAEPARSSGIGAGAILGALAGALIGHQIGGGGGRDAATAVGIVGGAFAGNAIENRTQGSQMRQVQRVTVQVDQGALRVFEIEDATPLRVGDRVRIENGLLYRY
ncbi:MAG: glycine zipper 2TM domain-containing protein [Burkholderiaceae bacterium]|nr:glycine zipper 2TM domain-containing protein [Burkholderiaceae bacterium]MDO9089675.1 glycine zipper 2TM domain-containing protein [Burkholderiaceae bacterium]